MSENFVDTTETTRRPGWNKVADPSTGNIASKTSGWTADRFTAATGGLEVDFSAVVPAGTRAVRCYVLKASAAGQVAARAEGDAAVSNTPFASNEDSHIILRDGSTLVGVVAEIWLSANYKAEFAVDSASIDLYVAYPREYLL